MKKVFVNIFIIGFSIFVALLVCEIVLRNIYPEERKKDDILGNIGQPGGEIDERGFRNDKALESAGIVAIGDSQTYGNNAKTSAEAWPQVLASLRGETVYQMAYGGYGPLQYNYLLDKALELNPEKIIIGLYLGNDINDAYRLACLNENWLDYCSEDMRGREIDSDGGEIRLRLQYGYETDSWQMKIIKIRKWIRKNSRVYALLGNGTRELRERIGLAHSQDEIKTRIDDWVESSDDAIIYKYNNQEALLSPSYRSDAIDLSKVEAREGVEILKKIFKEINEKSGNNNVDLLVVIIPTKEMIFYKYDELARKNKLERLENYAIKENELIGELEEFFNTESIEYLLLLNDMAESINQGKQIYGRSMDGHPLSTGYAVIAESINNYIIDFDNVASSTELISEN